MRSDRLLQAKVPVRFQTLLMEIPVGRDFGCRATGPQVPLLPAARECSIGW